MRGTKVKQKFWHGIQIGLNIMKLITIYLPELSPDIPFKLKQIGIDKFSAQSIAGFTTEDVVPVVTLKIEIITDNPEEVIQKIISEFKEEIDPEHATRPNGEDMGKITVSSIEQFISIKES